MRQKTESRQHGDQTEKPAGDDTLELWRRYQATRSLQDRNELVIHYIPMVRRISEFISKRNPFVDPDDILGMANLALVKLVESYDDTRGMSPSSYINNTIAFRVIDQIRTTSETVSRTDRTRARRIARAREAAAAGGVVSVEIEQIFNILGVPAHERSEWVESEMRAREATVTSLSRVAFDGDSGPVELGETIPDADSSDPSETNETADTFDTITRGLGELDRSLIDLYFREGMSMVEIGAIFGMSESRVSQKFKQIIEFLRMKHGREQPAAAAA